MSTTPNRSEIDKEAAYGRFSKGEDRKQQFDDRKRRFGLKLAHKAVDIPFEDEDVNVQANKHGIGGLALAGIVAAAGIGPAAMGLGMLWNQRDKLPVQLPGVEKVIKQDADVRIGKPVVEDE